MMEKECKLIMEMIDQGAITAEEGAMLLQALGQSILNPNHNPKSETKKLA